MEAYYHHRIKKTKMNCNFISQFFLTFFINLQLLENKSELRDVNSGCISFLHSSKFHTCSFEFTSQFRPPPPYNSEFTKTFFFLVFLSELQDIQNIRLNSENEKE